MRKKSNSTTEPTTETATPATNYNPFIDSVNEKPYSQVNVEVGQDRLYNPIPEPMFQGDSISANENAYDMLNNDGGDFGGGSNAGQSSAGQSFGSSKPLPDADTKKGAMHLAKLTVDGYELLWSFANPLVQISEKKVNEMAANGEFDPNVEIPYDYGKTIPAGEFIKEYNEQTKDAFTVSKEFKKEVTPLLAEIYAERGATLSKEATLGIIVAKDLATKSVQMFQMNKTKKDALEVIKEYTIALKENGGVPTKAQPQEPTTRSSDAGFVARPTVVDQPVTFDSADYNFATNEIVVESTVQKHSVPETGKSRLMAQRKREKEIESAMKKAESISKPKVSVSYQEAMQSKKTGKRGRKPKDYVKSVSEEEIADAIVLSETKKTDENPLEGLE
jgi:hypothetical protein